MTLAQFLKYILLFTTCCIYETNSDWVDPHSMDSNVKTKINSPYKYAESRGEYCSDVKNCDSDLYLRRIVRLILTNANMDTDDLDYLIGHIHLQLSKKDYEFLINFSQSDEVKEETFGEVGSIFEVALQKPATDRYKEMILTFQEQLYYLIFNAATGTLLLSFILLFVTYKLLRANFTWKSIFKCLGFLLYVVDFRITYLKIIKDEEINSMIALKTIGPVPPECNPQKLSWWSYIKTQIESTFFEHPCKAYYEAISNVEMHTLVPPTRVLTRQFKTLIVEPVGDIGEAFGKFGRQMFTHLPWGLNIAIFPIMLIASCLIIFIVLLFITRPRFKISLFHFFTLEIGESSRPAPRLESVALRAIQRTNRSEVGHTEHRALIEEASNDNCSSNQPVDNEASAVVDKESEAKENENQEAKLNFTVDNINSDSKVSL